PVARRGARAVPDRPGGPRKRRETRTGQGDHRETGSNRRHGVAHDVRRWRRLRHEPAWDRRWSGTDHDAGAREPVGRNLRGRQHAGPRHRYPGVDSVPVIARAQFLREVTVRPLSTSNTPLTSRARTSAIVRSLALSTTPSSIVW